MCGIAGIVAPSVFQTEKLRNMAVSMADTLVHRGPDSHGVWVDPVFHLAFSHRRLSIQDLSPAGHQPMVSSSGRFCIVFNGEIYNFQLLACELLNLGHRFRGHSDTEVLLAAMEEWGIDGALRRSRGMFAFAVWDKLAAELILCRDRMGEKPLFFGWVDKCFVFTSELKAVKAVFPGSLEIDKNALAAFFRFGYVPTPHSIYKNIFKLQPGSFLRIPLSILPTIDGFSPFPGESRFSPQAYWELDTVARHGVANPINDEQEALEQLDCLLNETIRQQQVADVPVGSFLSGGIDSSLVSALMQAVSNHPIQTFTIGFQEKEFDEAPYARAIAKHIGSNHHEYYVSTEEGLGLIEAIPRYWDEPFADSSQIPSLLVSQVARREVTVCLTGDGGDEMFCGYNRYFLGEELWFKQQKFPNWLRRITGAGLAAVPPKAWQASYLLCKKFATNKSTQANIGLKVHKFAGLLCMDSQHDFYRYLMSYWQNPGDLIPDIQESASILDRVPNPDLTGFIQNAMYWDQLGYLVDDNLVKGDRSSMAYGLETRLPLMDYRIVEFSWRLPLAMKCRQGVGKWLLRRLLDRYVPKVLIERPKMGFSVPINVWLKGGLKEWAEDLLFSSRCSSLPFELNMGEIKRVWIEHQKGRFDHSYKIWPLCILMAWTDFHK